MWVAYSLKTMVKVKYTFNSMLKKTMMRLIAAMCLLALVLAPGTGLGDMERTTADAIVAPGPGSGDGGALS